MINEEVRTIQLNLTKDELHMLQVVFNRYCQGLPPMGIVDKDCKLALFAKLINLPTHTKDDDCELFLDVYYQCTVCHVIFSDEPCKGCEQLGFHRDNCPEMVGSIPYPINHS